MQIVSAQQPTTFGLHGTIEPSQYTGAKIVRDGTNDQGIKNAFDTNDSTFLNSLIHLDSIGCKNIIYLIHNEDSFVNPEDIAWQRIPTGSDSIEVFTYLDSFLLTAGPYIDYIQINQEPMGITHYDTTQYSISEIFNWWRLLAQFIRDKQTQHYSLLGHLKIVSPSISSMIPSPQIEPIIDSMIAFGEDYCDVISLHIYPGTVEEGKQTIDYYRLKTTHPLACSEFSEAKTAQTTGWLNAINTIWTSSVHPFYALSNYEVIGNAYNTPMDSSEWKLFIETAPHNANFIHEMYAYMDSSCFEYACYAGMWQYGDPNFDWSAIVVNKCVTQFHFPNNPFFEEFTSLTSLINSGAYISNCQNTDVNRENMSSNVLVFPNPTNKHIRIEVDEIAFEHWDLKVSDLSGRIIFYQVNIWDNEFTLETKGFLPGVYFFQIQIDSDFSVTKNVIIE